MPEDSENQSGLDVTMESMLRYKTPVTLKNYLAINYPGKTFEELSAEEQSMIPDLLHDPRVSELDPSETYYEEILAELSRNPKLSVKKARQWMEEFA